MKKKDIWSNPELVDQEVRALLKAIDRRLERRKTSTTSIQLVHKSELPLVRHLLQNYLNILKELSPELSGAHKAEDNVKDNVKEQPQQALAKIEGLTFGDCIHFFDTKATERDRQIAALVEKNGELEVDGAIISEAEGGDNGAFVSAWVWVSFEGTDLKPLGKFEECEPIGARMEDGTIVTPWDERLRSAGGSPIYEEK